MIETARCLLDGFRPEDAEAFYRLNTDAEVRRFLGGPADMASLQQTFAWLTGPGAPASFWAIRQKERGVFIGQISLGPHHDGADRELSYQLLPEWWRQGYGKEVSAAVLGYGLNELGLPRVIAETQTANLASRALLASLGMRLERTLERFGAGQSVYVLEGSASDEPDHDRRP